MSAFGTFDPINHARYQEMLEDPTLNNDILSLLDLSDGPVALPLEEVLPAPHYVNTAEKMAGHFSLLAAGLYERAAANLAPLEQGPGGIKPAAFRTQSDPYTTLTRHFHGRLKPGAALLGLPLETADIMGVRRPEEIKHASKIILAVWILKGGERIPGLVTCLTTVRQSENGQVIVSQGSTRDRKTTAMLARVHELSKRKRAALDIPLFEPDC